MPLRHGSLTSVGKNGQLIVLSHLIQRGINRQACFVCEEDYQTCLRFLIEGAQHYGTEIHSWVLDQPCTSASDPEGGRRHFKDDAMLGKM